LISPRARRPPFSAAKMSNSTPPPIPILPFPSGPRSVGPEFQAMPEAHGIGCNSAAPRSAFGCREFGSRSTHNSMPWKVPKVRLGLEVASPKRRRTGSGAGAVLDARTSSGTPRSSAGPRSEVRHDRGALVRPKRGRWVRLSTKEGGGLPHGDEAAKLSRAWGARTQANAQ